MFFNISVLILVISLSSSIRAENCTYLPIAATESISLDSHFDRPSDRTHFRSIPIFSISNRANSGFYPLSPRAFIDAETGELHQLPGRILNGTQDGRTIYYQDHAGRLHVYNVQSRQSQLVAGVGPGVTCRAQQNITTFNASILVHQCTSPDNSSVLVFGDGSGRVVNLTAAQSAIYNASSDQKRFMLNGHIQVRSDQLGYLNISSENRVTSTPPSSTSRILWVNPNLQGQSIELQAESGIYLVTSSSRRLIHGLNISQGEYIGIRVFTTAEQLVVNLAYSGNQKVIRINLGDYTSSELTLDAQMQSDGIILVSETYGPYIFGTNATGAVQRVSLSTFENIPNSRSAGQTSTFLFEGSLTAGDRNLIINEKVLVETAGSNLNFYPNRPENLICISNNRIQISNSRQCSSIRNITEVQCQNTDNPIRSRGPSAEVNIIRWLAARVSNTRLNLLTDLTPLVQILNSDFIARYPQLLRRVLQNVQRQNPSLFSRLSNIIRRLPDSTLQDNCPVNYEACSMAEDNVPTINDVRAAGEFAARTGDIAALQLFNDDIGQLSDSERQQFIGRISLARAQIRLDESSVSAEEESESPFQQIAAARSEAMQALGVESLSELEGGVFARSNWNCPTSLMRAPADRTVASIRYLPAANLVDFSGLDDLMSQLAQHSQYDFTPCLAQLMQRLVQNFENELMLLGNMDAENITNLKQLVEDQLNSKLFEYALSARDAQAPSYLIAAANMHPVIYPQLINSQLRQIRNCSFPMNSYVLDENFLRELATRSSMIRSLNPECRRTLEQNYTQVINSTLLTQEQCENRSNECQVRVDNAATAIQYLMQAEIIQDQNYLEFASFSCNSGRSATGFLNDLYNMQNEVIEVNQCTPLEINETREIDINKSVRGRYRIQRRNAQNYQITLKLFLTEGENQTNSPLTRSMFSEITRCFNSQRGNFRGPNGESLNFNFEQASDADSFDAHHIRIHPSYPRANSGNYPADISCPTILHEVMHLLGLADEYHENARGFRVSADGSVEQVTEDADIVANDCRAEGPTDSLMHHQTGAIEMNTPKRNASGAEYRSLLYPAQFRFITNPMCDSLNETFNACTISAYQTSAEQLLDNLGRLQGRMSCAAGLPRYCNDPSGGWLQ